MSELNIQDIIDAEVQRNNDKLGADTKKTYTLYSDNEQFEVLKVWNSITGGIPTVELVPNLIYTVTLTEQEHKKYYGLISSISYSIRNKLDETRSTLDRYLNRYDMHLNSSPMHESIDKYLESRNSRLKYCQSIKDSLTSTLTMTSDQLINQVVDHLTPLVSCNESDLRKFISALYDELLNFADRWYQTNCTVSSMYYTKSSIRKNNQSAFDLYYDIEKELDAVKTSQFQGYSESKYSKLGKKALKASGIKEFECPQFNKWQELHFDHSDENEILKRKIEQEALTPYKGQSFYGLGDKPFQFFYFERINDQFDSSFHAIQQTVKEHMITYIGGRNINRFCEFMDSINNRLENGEAVLLDEVKEFIKPNP